MDQRERLTMTVRLRSKPYLREISLKRERIADFDKYPFCIPAVRNLDVPELYPDVTFLVGRKVLRSRHCPQRRHC
jgi:hypothetical protein